MGAKSRADWDAEYDERRRKQTEALAQIKFGEASILGGLLGSEGATCQTCGALVLITNDEPGEQPAVKHRAWHLTRGEGQDV